MGEHIGKLRRENPEDRATIMQNALTGVPLMHGFTSQAVKDLMKKAS